MDYLISISRSIAANHILNISMFAWLVAQFLKVLIILSVQKKVDIKRFLGAGGMPSSHSATVSALAASVLKYYGFESVEFAITVVFAAVVMYDAAGVRRAAGEQAKVLNHILDNWQEQTPFEKNLNELLGHTPLQVLAGAILGIAIGILL